MKEVSTGISDKGSNRLEWMDREEWMEKENKILGGERCKTLRFCT